MFSDKQRQKKRKLCIVSHKADVARPITLLILQIMKQLIRAFLNTAPEFKPAAKE